MQVLPNKQEAEMQEDLRLVRGSAAAVGAVGAVAQPAAAVAQLAATDAAADATTTDVAVAAAAGL